MLSLGTPGEIKFAHGPFPRAWGVRGQSPCSLSLASHCVILVGRVRGCPYITLLSKYSNREQSPSTGSSVAFTSILLSFRSWLHDDLPASHGLSLLGWSPFPLVQTFSFLSPARGNDKRHPSYPPTNFILILDVELNETANFCHFFIYLIHSVILLVRYLFVSHVPRYFV